MFVEARVDYIVTGSWSEKAAQEARKYCDNVNVINCQGAAGYTSISDKTTWNLSEDPAYVYYCDNETVDGVEFTGVPNVKVRCFRLPLPLPLFGLLGLSP